jgi:RNA polymerase sigma-70 factor, ECF subfamily
MGDAAHLYRKSGAERWGVTPEVFAAALARSAAKAFAGRSPSDLDIDRYRQSLHLEDLALACACEAGTPEAWDHFVVEFRPALYRAADAIDRSGTAREIADSLYGELFSKSLFRYFHGRSSLATWLRSLVAQRYVDRFRETKRHEPLPDEDTPSTIAAPAPSAAPERARFAAIMQTVLAAAIAALDPRDRLRLRCYYAQEMTLAQIGRLTREHEATVSRQLARTRKDLRSEIERRLKHEHRLGAAEIRDCISSVVDDTGTLDLGVLLSERKNPESDRSTVEGVS